MLLGTLKYIASDLNSFLKRKYDSQEERVVLGNIVDQNNSVPESNQNKIILTLLSLEHETNIKKAINYIAQGPGYVKTTPPLAFNLDIMFSGLFSQYEESLKFLSDTIQFFQAKPFFNHENSPGLGDKISQFSLEIIKLSSSETYNLWASLGTKYVPSVPFKLRLIFYQSEEVEQLISSINSVSGEALPQL